MATITRLTRFRDPALLTYPEGHVAETCATCKECTGLSACCEVVDALVVTVQLSDGRRGTCWVKWGDDDAVLLEAIAAWSQAHPLEVDPLVGESV